MDVFALCRTFSCHWDSQFKGQKLISKKQRKKEKARKQIKVCIYEAEALRTEKADFAANSE